MRPSYYVIELSRRWLTVLLVALALVMVLAFALGYGAAWSVFSKKGSAPAISALAAAALPTATEIPEVVIAPSEETPTAAPTATVPSAPTATPPPPTPTPTSTPSPTPAQDAYHVQVLASSSSASVAEARSKLERLGFPRSNQQLITVQESGRGVLYKLRIGPFPDRASAERIVQRMSAAGFSDAWVVVP